MHRSRTDASTRALFGDEELAVAWLAENAILPVKNRWGRYTLREPPGESGLTQGEKLLIVSKLGVESEEDLAEIQRKVRNHPRWKPEKHAGGTPDE